MHLQHIYGNIQANSGDKAIKVLISLAPNKLVHISRSWLYLCYVRNKSMGVEMTSMVRMYTTRSFIENFIERVRRNEWMDHNDFL